MRRLATLACACLPLFASAQDTGSRSVHLVTISKLGEIAAMGLRKSIEPMKRQGMTDKQAACVLTIEGSRYVPTLARVADAELTPAEIEEAIRFYESPAGRKYTDMTLVQSAKMIGTRTNTTMPDFSQEEVKATEDFGKTLVFQKLVNENILTRSPTGQNEIRALTMQILQGCGAGRQG